jgi:hypothetical protein
MAKSKLGFTAEESTFYTKIITLGSATKLPVLMSPSELAKLIGVIYFDTGNGAALKEAIPDFFDLIFPVSDYYGLPMEWFTTAVQIPEKLHVDLMRLGQNIPDFKTYLLCLSGLHKRRRKYAMILRAQPIPTMVQISPRALVEYGGMEVEALASWLTWRKFFYDLDNRSAQETGYLFEPILAAAIGGEPKGPTSKVVTRTGDDTKGRQVDCWKVDAETNTKYAYEFKLRVTTAASGQGRIGEEIQFATDCLNSGAIPVLVVLDPTPNNRLTELKTAFEKSGGHAFIGAEAWQHLEEEAGDTMAQFIERYVRRPITEVTSFENYNPITLTSNITLLDFNAKLQEGNLLLSLGTHERKIIRAEDKSLESSDGEKENKE